MKTLIVPMAAMAETAGSFSRARLLANALLEEGMKVGICCAKDINYSKIEGTVEYPLSVPMPLGLPGNIAKNMFPIAQKLGLTAKKNVGSFEEVLHLTGNTDYKYLNKSVSEIRTAIKEFRPDIVYSEFNISAIIAARLEGKRLFISASVPTLPEYGRDPKFATGLNRLLAQNGLEPVESCMDVFEWAEKKFVPSIYELEPMEDSKVVYCGSLKTLREDEDKKRDKILVYMGNGTVSMKKVLKEIPEAFKDTGYEVYIAGQGLKEAEYDNIHTAPWFDFGELLPESALFINHGGQNSIIDGLIHKTPLLVCPGRVFERKYNAASIVKTGAGISIDQYDFTAEKIKETADKIFSDDSYKTQADILGRRLRQLGGVANIVREIKA